MFDGRQSQGKFQALSHLAAAALGDERTPPAFGVRTSASAALSKMVKKT
jgi:hypothetical protein